MVCKFKLTPNHTTQKTDHVPHVNATLGDLHNPLKILLNSHM